MKIIFLYQTAVRFPLNKGGKGVVSPSLFQFLIVHFVRGLVFILTLISITAIYSCHSPLGVEENIVKTNDEQFSYFPMHVGDTWTYNYVTGYDTSEVTIKITDKKTLGGKEYYEMKIPSLFDKSNATTDSSVYLRLEDGSKIIKMESSRYDSPGSGDESFIDFDKDQNSNVSYGYVFAVNITVELDWKTFRYCKGVTYGGADPAVEYYAPGVGLVWRTWFKGRMLLKSAVVDGKIVK